MARPSTTYNGSVEVITEKPSRVVCRYKLDSGKVLTVWFDRLRNRGQVSREIRYVWGVAMCISDTKEWANWWRRGGGRKNPITGTGDLEGLRLALRYVRAFAEHKIGPRAALQVSWADERRKRAYRYLLRYEGWSMQRNDGRDVCLEYRDPECWVDLTKEELANG